MEIFYVILALVLGIAVGFVLGVRVKAETVARLNAQRAAKSDKGKAPQTDTRIVPGFQDRPTLTEQTVSFPAAYTGDVFVTLWLPSGTEATDTDVEIIWGAARGVIALPALNGRAVSLKFSKNSVDGEDALVLVRTSVPTCRYACLNTPPEGTTVREDINWA